MTHAQPTRTRLNQHEDTTGVVYLNNRYHDPLLGSFISVDPLVTTTWEPYVYASANRATLSDPAGLCAWDQWDCDAPTNTWGRPDGTRSGTTLLRFDDVSDETLGEIVAAGSDVFGGESMAMGVCGNVSWLAGVGVSFDGCIVATGDDWGIVGTAAAGAGAGIGASVGPLFSNAGRLDDLEGYTVCVGASYGVGVTVCGGLRPDGLFSGIVTVYATVGIDAGAVAVFGETYARSWGGTPWFVRWLLPSSSPGRAVDQAEIDLQHILVGRHDAGPGGFYDAGTPG